jgi:hypothetical protein
MTQIGSQPARMELPALESWPWQTDETARTHLYQSERRARPPAPTPMVSEERPEPRPTFSEEIADEHFLPAPPRGWRLRTRPSLRLPRIRFPRLRPIHVIIFTTAVVSMLMVGLALWAWQSERDRTDVAGGGDLAQVPITVITVSGPGEGGAAVQESRVSHASRSFRQRRRRRRRVHRRARRSRARRHQVDVDGILAAGRR